MFVDPKTLHSGGDQSHRAGDHAQEAAGHLSRAFLPSGMFGEFSAAEDFHGAVTAAHAQQHESPAGTPGSAVRHRRQMHTGQPLSS